MATLVGVLDEVSLGKNTGDSKQERREEVKKLSECPFSRVVVYTDQAEVRREVACKLSGGENTVTIVDFPEVMDPDSVRVELKGKKEGTATITDVVYVSQYRLEETGGGDEKNSAVAETVSVNVSEREQLSHEKAILEKKRGVLKKELTLLSKLKAVLVDGGAQSCEEALKRLKLATDRQHLNSIVDFVEYFCSRSEELENRGDSLQEQLDCVNTKLETIRLNAVKSGELTEKKGKVKGGGDEFTRAVQIVLESDGAESVEVLLSYLVSRASWSSLYHLRVSIEDSIVQVHYFGQVSQSTGEDWVNTPISLSTASPSKGGSPPVLTPHNIYRYYPPAPVFPGEYMPTMFYGESMEFSSRSSRKSRVMSSAQMMPPMQLVEESQSEVKTGLFVQTFDVSRPVTIPSDNTEHKVSVTVIDLESVFEHLCLPEESGNVYLIAKATNTSDYPLMSGPSSVFVDNDFISKSRLESVSPGEEVRCSLGVDPLVRVKFKGGESFQSHQPGWISKGTTSQDYHKTTTVKNRKGKRINVKVVESVPVSQDERIKVHLIHPSGCKKVGVKVFMKGGGEGGSVMLNEKNHLEWCLEVSANCERKFTLIYTIEYPIS